MRHAMFMVTVLFEFHPSLHLFFLYLLSKLLPELLNTDYVFDIAENTQI